MTSEVQFIVSYSIFRGRARKHDLADPPPGPSKWWVKKTVVNVQIARKRITYGWRDSQPQARQAVSMNLELFPVPALGAGV